MFSVRLNTIIKNFCFSPPLVGPGINVLPAVVSEAICPDLVKMTAYDVTRRGAIIDNSGKTSGMICSRQTIQT